MAHRPDVSTRSAGGRHGHPWRAVGVALVVLLALGGTAQLAAGLSPAPVRPPQPADVAAAVPELPPPTAVEAVEPQPEPSPEPALDPEQSSPTPGPVPAQPHTVVSGTQPPEPVGLPRSEPVTITIPKIKVNAKIMSVGVDENGMVQVPSLKQARLAGWYKAGASPGEIGNAVVVGHVDSAATGPAVFFRLGALGRGDQVQVTRKDGRVVRFAVDTVKSYPKTAFPSELVYGATDTARLQVVTCGGRFDRRKGSYSNNVVLSATRIP